jgi:hypothetical protein
MPGIFDEYDSIIKSAQGSGNPQLRGSLYSSADTSPDEEASFHKLAKKTGLPVESLRVDKGAEARRLAAAQSSEDLPPATSSFLSDPANAKISHDDTENLADLERITRNGFGAKGPVSTLDFAGKSDKAAADKAHEYVGAVLGGLKSSPSSFNAGLAETGRIAMESTGWGSALRSLSDMTGQDVWKNIAEAPRLAELYWESLADESRVKTKAGTFPYYLQSASNSLGVSLMAAPFGMAGEGPALGIFSLSASGGQEELRGAGYSEAGAAATSIPKKMMEGLTEKIGLDALYKGGKPFVKAMTEFIFKDLAGEEINTLYNAIADKLTVKPKMTLFDLGQEIVDTAIVTGLMGGGQGAAFHGSAQVADMLKTEFEKSRRTRAAVNVMESLGEATKNSKTFQRMPEKLRDIISEVTKDGPVENVYVPADKLKELFQSEHIDIETMLDDPSSYYQALEVGGDVVIPLSEYVEKWAGSEYHQTLLEDMRLHPGDMTQRELKEWSGKMPDELAAMIKGFDEEGKANAGEKQVFDAVLGELLGAGRDRSTAEREALLWQSRYKSRSERLGRDAWDLFKENPLRVNRETPDFMRRRDMFDTSIDPFLDRLRAGDIPSEREAYGDSLVDFLRAQGVQDEKGELKFLGVDEGLKPFERNLIQEKGISLGRAGELAHELGYFHERPSVADLLDAIDTERRGTPRYKTAIKDQAIADLRANLEETQRFLDMAGISLADSTNEEIRAKLKAMTGDSYNQLGYKVKPPKKLYRGVAEGMQEDGTLGTGTAMLGRGLYSTPDKSFAKKYGKVSEVSIEDGWPHNPLVLNNAAGGAPGALSDWLLKESGLKNIREFNKVYNDDIASFMIERGYDGVIAGDEVVKYKVPDTFYQDAIAEDLIITHNVTGKNVLHAIKLGGIPVPSLAITKKDQSLTAFGEITLLGSRSMADPKGYASTKVFGADIYSPRYPSVTLQYSAKGRKSFEEKLGKWLEKLGERLDFDELEKGHRAQEYLVNNTAVVASFLEKQGITPETVNTDENAADLERLKSLGYEKWFGSRDWLSLAHDKEFQQVAVDSYIAKLKKAGLDDRALAAERKSMDEENRDYRYNMAKDDAMKIERIAREGAGSKINKIETRKSLEKQVKDGKLQDELEAYAEELVEAADPQERLFMGYTNTGRRYIAHTLENVVKILKKEIRGGENFSYGVGSLRAHFTPQFRTVKQIQEGKDRLVTKEEFEKVKKEIDDDFFALVDKIRPQGGTRAKEFGFADTVINIFEEAAKLGLRRAFKEYGIEGVDDAILQESAEFLERLRHLPTEYFEAKILRDVDLSEFAAAIAPDTIAKDVRAALEKRGLKVETYKQGNEEDRRSVVARVAETANGIHGTTLFQSAFHGSPQPWDVPQQKVSSASTSISYPDPGKKAPIIFSAFRDGKITLGPVNADIGGGRFDSITKWLKGEGVENIVWDKFNRDAEHNTKAEARLRGGQADTATVSNVLNVIAEPEARAAVIATAMDAVRPGGEVFFSMYTAPKMGEVKGRDAFQTGMKTADYISEIEAIFGEGSVKKKGNVLIATKTLEMFQKYAEGKRGSITFGPGIRDISLLEKADLSTFLHESSHAWLEELRQDASLPDAPDQIREDFNTIAAWAGFDPSGPIPVEAHEMFARGGEAYLMEGKAPSAELQPAFQRFKAWLMRIYRSLNGLNVKLTDEVRGVMDRLLATDEEIKRAEELQAFHPLFTDAASAGMTEREFAAYRTEITRAHDQAETTLQQKLMKEISREQEAWWKEEREKVRGEVEAEAQEEPAYQVFQALTTGKDFEGAAAPEGFKLSKADLVRMYGKEFVKKLPRAFHYVYAKEGGLHPDAIAEVFGFSSGDEMIQKMANAPPLKKFVEAETTVRMRQTYGDMLNDGTIADEALQAIHSDYSAQVLRAELRALKRKQREVSPFVKAEAEKGADALKREKDEREYERRWLDAENKLKLAIEKGAADEEIRKLREEIRINKEGSRKARMEMEAGIPPLQAFKMWASQTIGAKAVKDIRPGEYARAEQKAGRLAFEAAAKGKYQEAGEQKQKQLLNHYLYIEAVAAKEDAQKIYDYAKKLEKPATQAKLGKAGSDYLEQINGILERYEFRKQTLETLTKRRSLLEWARQQEELGLEVSSPEEMFLDAGKRNYKDLTVDELRAVRDALKNIEHLAREMNRIRIDNEEIELEEAIAELSGAVGQNFKTRRIPIDKEIRTWIEKQGEKVDRFDASLVKAEQLIEWMDGGKIDGPWARMLFRPIAAAESLEHDLTLKFTGKIADLFEAYGKEKRDSLMDKIEIPSLGESITRQAAVAVALNLGNESNRTKLLEGYGWGEIQLEEITARLDANDWAFVQLVWDTIEELWPDIAALEKRMTGVAPEKVVAREFTNEFGTWRGGYYPVVYDPAHSAAGEKAEDAKGDRLFDAAYVRATTEKGHTKARIEGAAYPILLSLEVIPQHIAQVVHDITHREAVVTANRLLNNAEIRILLNSTIGAPYYRMLKQWLAGVANDRNIDRTGLEFWTRFMSGLRTNATIVGMGFRMTTMVTQLVGLSQSLDIVKGKYLTKGFMRFARHPFEAAAWVAERSGEMRHRRNSLDRDIRDGLRKLMGKHGAKQWVQGKAFMGIALFDAIVSIPTWLGAHEQAQAEGLTEKDAIAQADRAIRLSQGSGGAKDLAAVQRSNDMMKLFTMFYSYFSVLYNRLRNMGRLKGMDELGYLDVAFKSFVMVIVPAIVADLMVGRGPDDDEDAAWWALRKVLVYPFLTIPFVRDIANSFESGRPYSMTPMSRLFEMTAKLPPQIAAVANNEKELEDLLLANFDIPGYAFGLPTGQVRTTTKYLWDLDQGNVTAEDMADVFKGMLFGQHHKK